MHHRCQNFNPSPLLSAPGTALLLYGAGCIQLLTKLRVSTNAGVLRGMGLGKGHFTHIIIDEAAQMMEAEALIPISFANKRCAIVMAGDDKQLGPQIQSPSAAHHGIDVSVMERMVKLPVRESSLNAGVLTAPKVYSQRKDSNFVVELVKNYRSHHSIVSISSELFYSGKLQALADPQLTSCLCDWAELPEPNFPVMFYGVEGKDMR